jgi:DNA repair exonuclease SbcCD ATPase subunit
MDALEKLKNILAASRTETDNYVSRQTLIEAVEQMEAGLSWMRTCDELTAECMQHKAEIQQLKEAVRVRGGCRMLSDGDKCNCGLCKRDNEIQRLTESERRSEQQLCDIAHFFQKDARHVEGDGEKSIATLVKQEVQRLQQDKADLLAQLKDARKEINLLRDEGRIRQLEQELEPLRRLRDSLAEVLKAELPWVVYCSDVENHDAATNSEESDE